MSIVKPFKGLRPRADLAKEIACPPYDVLNVEEAREIVSDLIIEIHHGCDRFVKDTNQEKLPEYKAVKELEQ